MENNCHNSSAQGALSVDLPYELEQYIFELAAITHPGFGTTLALLSSYVQEWMERIVYRTIVLDPPARKLTFRLFLRTLNSRPASFFAARVKNLYLTSSIPMSEAARIIQVCTGVENLTCWAEPGSRPRLCRGDFCPKLLDILQTHRITRLSVKIESLFDRRNLLQAMPWSLFPNLSHLEIVNPPDSLDASIHIDWEGVSQLPRLTHFALGDLWSFSHTFMLPILVNLLASCTVLRSMVLITEDQCLIQALERSGIAKDKRVVVIPSFHWTYDLREYWSKVKRGGFDFWSMADEELEKKKRRPSSSSSPEKNGEIEWTESIIAR